MRASTQKLHDAITAEIAEIGAPPPYLIQQLLKRVEEEYYNDYCGEPTFPIMALVHDLHLVNFHRIAARAVEGEFDGTKEEADEWKASAEGTETFARFGHMFPKQGK